MDGFPVGVMANNLKYNGGSMDIAAGEKTLRLLDLCETFHLPLVYFADEPGFSVAPTGGARYCSCCRVVSAFWQAAHLICFVVRQLYGVAGIAFSQRGPLQALRLAFHAWRLDAHRRWNSDSL